MLRLTEYEVRLVNTLTAPIPDIHEGNCKPGCTPNEIKRLIAETRMRNFGGDVAIAEFRRQHAGRRVEQVDLDIAEYEEKTVDKLLSTISVF
jgi:hypothetical protein